MPGPPPGLMSAPRRYAVGDRVRSPWGEAAIKELRICPLPDEDPKGEDPEVSPKVEALDPRWIHTWVADLDNGHWAYPHQLEPA